MKDALELHAWIDSARRHGEDSEPDHEVGDLIALVHTLWKALGEAERRRALAEHAQRYDLWPKEDP